MRFWPLSLLVLSLSACSWSHFPLLYKQDVQQGNVSVKDNRDSIKLGMSREEVIYLLGNPVLTNVLDDQNVQYVYTFKKGQEDTPQEQRFILSFNKADKLVAIQ